MASFADKFLKDLEELSGSDNEDLDRQDLEPEDEKQSSEDEADFAEYQEREQKVEKLLGKGYTSKVRGNAEFERHIENLERELAGETLKENLSKKEVAQGLIVQTNEYLKHIDNDIIMVHK
jgi:hypothetical protein